MDIIAQKNNTLHLIEVKARRGQAFGFPEEGVSLKKIENLLQAGDEFQVQYPEWRRLQYDVLSILITSARVEYFLIEDVYL